MIVGIIIIVEDRMSRFRYKSAREQYFDDGARDNN